MNLEGKVIAALPAKSGISKTSGNAWKSQEYVIETADTYPHKCCFNVWGEDKINQFNIKVGETINVSFDIDAHEYQGRWFNSIQAWKVERVNGTNAAPQNNPMPSNNAAPTNGNDSNLPF